MTSTKAFRLGLIGHPVSHSKSPEIFREKFGREGFPNASYELFDLPTLDNFEAWIKQQANADIPLLGFNVTVPHKTQIIPFLTTISAEAQAIQAVNTVVVSRNPITQEIELHGHNTDVDGFAKSLEIISDSAITQAIILGDGGSAKAVRHILNRQKITYFTLQRGRILETNTPLNELQIPPHTLIIQTTPVGMWPNIEAHIEFPFHQLSQTHVVIDLIYNPSQTTFMKKCEERGAITLNGQTMLNAQAETAWQLFKSALSTP
ncbi:MAG: shikimate dehydrogenase [Flavobacteriaceae bacterium]|nr:shikimate dehydrogenase [Flavobacteriaceae bacterium]PHX77151.1 MAG: shikimate dehydrogenase [Flavobacteriales bacterium]